jgi:hypothetical protein
VGLLQTFFNRRFQPFHQQGITMLMYPGPICPNRPFFVELGDMEISTWVRGALAQGVI